MRMILSLLLLSCLAMQSQSSSWNCANNCLIKWDFNCLWYWAATEAISSAEIPSEQCGEFCLRTNGCKAFDWFGGICYTYRAVNGPEQRLGGMCGYREFWEKEAEN